MTLMNVRSLVQLGVLLSTTTAWATERPMMQQLTEGTKWALAVVLIGLGLMWLLFSFVQKFGGMGTGFYKPHTVQDIGPIDRKKSDAFAVKERENMRQPYVDNYDYPEFPGPDVYNNSYS